MRPRSLALLMLALAGCETVDYVRASTVEPDEQTIVAMPDDPAQRVKPIARREGKGTVEQGEAEEAAVAEGDELVCTTERIVGSNLPRRVCRTQRSIDREKDEAYDAMVRQRSAQ